MFHNACLDHIIDVYKKRFEEKSLTLKEVIIWTDNCAGQYKCKYNFWKLATFHERHGVNIRHRFAQKYGCKGPWDAAGKALKGKLYVMEVAAATGGGTTKKKNKRRNKHLRCPSGWALCNNMPEQMKLKTDWKRFEEEGNEHLSKKGKFGVDNRFYGFVCENPADLEKRT